ncbi:uncharacterized protein LOC128176925 [Crassostrea angulata]|uniref:uncharacterized protein LOC128176925 n=1 Tax=Magallana angulata TaxID=2784310 RepID=UPI0022B1692C|nr:uncharacterized protein LOC128176925 [Crassostrea angulata]
MTSKLRAVRSGQRSAVTRLLKKLEESFLEENNTEDIETIVSTLKEKQEILRNLDDRILEDTVEEDVEKEILEADEYKFDIESKIKKIKKHLLVQGSTLNATASSYQYLDRNENLQIEKNAHSTHDFSQNSCVQQTVTSLNLNPNSNSGATHSANSHKLPKLNLPIFEGNLLEWQTFWDCYNTSIHGNNSLSDVEKFSYLRSLLCGEALRVISGFSLTNTNYRQAIDVLFERYGQNHKIVNAHIQALINIQLPKSNPDCLRIFYDKMECCIRGLESLGTDETTYGTILTPMIYNKLPADIRKNITRDKGDDNWDLNSLRRAIKKELCVQDAGNASYTRSNQESQEFIPTANFVTGANHKKTIKQGTTVKQCLFCNGKHSPTACHVITDYEERISIVKQKKVCFNCFGKHKVSECQSHFKCRNCKKLHHTSICRNSQFPRSTSERAVNAESTQFKQPHQREQSFQLHSSSHVRANTEVLLKTAVTPIWYRNQEVNCNVLLDEGAQNSFITEELAQKLDIKSTGSITLKISAFGDKNSEVRNLEKATVQLETQTGEKIPMEVIIIPTIAAPIFNRARVNIRELSYLKGLKLAHPISSDEQFHISMLIGADYYWSIVGDRIIRGNGPTAVESKVGYLISGPIHSSGKQHSGMFHILADHKVEEVDLEKFWKIESMGIDDHSEEIKGKEKLLNFAATSIDKEDGHHVAKIPWKENSPCLPTNYEIVKRRTENVIQRLAKDPKICKDKTGHVSLNDCIEPYSPVMNDITSILTRFRLNKFAVTADIEKAFLQIELHQKDRDATRFLWLSDPGNASSPLTTYRFRSVLFGATCSPFILSATLMKHFQENANETSSLLEQNLYVDNVLASFQSEETAMKFYKESRTLLAAGGFNLRSWSSNSEMLQNLSKAEKTADEDSVVKVLGMKWNPQEDTLQYAKNDTGQKKYRVTTKREVLRETSKVFDPLELLSPISVKAKIFMQELWKANLKWDEKLPKSMQTTWREISSEICDAKDIKINRNNSSSIDSRCDSLHVFSDASQQAYGACVYLLSKNKITLLMAKNRVTPIKQITLLRLELMGALIGARLGKHVKEITGVNKIYFWCDSQIVLHWIISQKTPNRFVANRVNEIREISKSSTWQYCPTYCNPADYLTRGIALKKFKEDTLWWNGPEWLMEPQKWPVWDGPTKAILCSTSTEEESDMSHQTKVQDTVDIKTESIQSILKLEDKSSLMMLVRVLAYIRRFIHNCRHSSEKRAGFLSKQELGEVIRLLIQDAQRTEFTKEMEYLKHPSGRKPTLIQQLKLFLDNEGFLRCGGRIHNAPLMDKTKFPYLLPTYHRLTHLIIVDTHNKHAHASLNSTITLLHEQYWIPRIRQRVKGILRGCISCRKVIGKSYQAPEPPPLPKDRLQMKPPFTVTGIDFAGPLYVKDKLGENSKAYICLFTCASTRALHLELVPNLTQSSFLLAFRRFISRRSLPSIMISDNATTFQSASKEIIRSSHAENVHQKLAEYGVQWKFIPSRAPWYGGWWERLIGLTKTSLLKVLGRSKINMETLHTVVTEIEAMLNDRPLKAIRAGHRGTITNFLRRISETNNEDEHCAMIKILEEKQDILEKINSQILQELSSEEEIQMENRDSVEYMSHLRLRLAELTKIASSSQTLENVHQFKCKCARVCSMQ